MSLRRLDAGPSTLLVDCRDDRFQICYLGRHLPGNLDLTEVPQLTRALTPHGELDCELLRDGFPTQDGHSQTQAALQVRRHGRALLTQLRVTRCTSSPTVLVMDLEDVQAKLAVSITLSGSASGVFCSTTTVTNTATKTSLDMDWLASLHLPLPNAHREMERYGGFWANELLCERVGLGQFAVDTGSTRGRSSHQSSPTLLTGEPGFSQETKSVLLASLEWSGNHRLRIEPSPAGGHSLQAGLALQAGELCLEPGKQWRSPPALFALSNEGVNGLRRQLRNYWYERKNLAPDIARPVHFNSWEASYFGHDARSSCQLIDAAAELGAERFVLDDGWMQDRVGIGCGLGDWAPCSERYPQGLKPIATYARSRGMSFGLWVEPEMVTLDSRVAQKHPEWVIGIADYPKVTGRKQYLLNVCIPDVREHILACLQRLINDCEPDYLKWDMNRDHAQVGFGSTATPRGMTEAWYELLGEVHRRYPSVTIESCAAGGARTDAGALAHSDRIWPSDSLDPLQRFKVMKHASCVFPPALLGTHVGSSPSSTSGASLPFSTRCIIALLGHMGIELDPGRLEASEHSTLQRWITFFKVKRRFLAQADFYFLDEQEPGLESLLLFDATAGQGLLLVLREAYPHSAQPPIIRLPNCVSGCRFNLQLLNPEDADFVQQSIDWHRGGVWPVSGDALHLAGLRAPFLRIGHCALIALSNPK